MIIYIPDYRTPQLLIHTRDADDVQRSLQLLHLFVKQIISFPCLHFLSEPHAGDINGWFGFLILEKHLRETFAQTFLTFLK